MPATKKQIKQGRLKARAENEEETPMRRIRAAKSLLLLSNFTRDPSRIARRTATKLITDGTVTEDVRERAAKLLELASSHAVNENEPEDDEEIELPTQFQIKRTKSRKGSKVFQEAVSNGDDFLGHFFEPLSLDDASWPASDEDFKNAKIKARDILLPTIDKDCPRYFMEGGSFTDQRTEYGEKLFSDFRALVREILNTPTAYKEPEPAISLASPTDYGVPVSLTRDQIIPRPDLSVPPELKPGEFNARATCSICWAGGFALPHDCMRYQQDFS